MNIMIEGEIKLEIDELVRDRLYKVYDDLFKSACINDIPTTEYKQIVKFYGERIDKISKENNLIKYDDKKIEQLMRIMHIYQINTLYPYELKNANIMIDNERVKTTRKMPRYAIVTFYPASCFGVDGYKMRLPTKINKLICDENEFEILTSREGNRYQMNLTDKLYIYGSPKRCDNKLILGHKIRDSIEDPFRDIKDEEITSEIMEKKVIEYITKSRNNCVCLKNVEVGMCYIVTTRRIEKGDELLMSYGISYWADDKYGKKYSMMIDKIMDQPHVSELMIKNRRQFMV